MAHPRLPDPYRRQAQREGFASRAVYKLQAIDSRFRLFRAGQRVLDLGCSPGSWLQYVASRVGADGLVVGIDQAPLVISPQPPIHYLAMDVLSLDLTALMVLSPYFDVVVSDLAPATCGIKEVDQQRSLSLAEAAWACARQVLRPGGHFLVKVFEGPDLKHLIQRLTETFLRCHRLKPRGSRRESAELYILALHQRVGAEAGSRRQ